MCNKLHKNSKPIKKEGTGWKVFSRECETEKFGTWASIGFIKYVTDSDGWTYWIKEKKYIGDGFCFLLDKKEAEKFKLNKTFNVLKKIKYKGGLGHFEDFITLGSSRPLKTALCTSFKIIEEN